MTDRNLVAELRALLTTTSPPRSGTVISGSTGAGWLLTDDLSGAAVQVSGSGQIVVGDTVLYRDGQIYAVLGQLNIEIRTV